MSNASTIRAALKIAIAALVPSGTNVYEARVPQMVFAVALRRPAVVIAYGGKPKAGEGPVGRRDRQGYVYAFTIAVVGEDWQTPEGAAYDAADISDALMALRTVQLTTINGNPVYLAFESETPEVLSGATEQGGLYAMVQSWRTNEVRA